MYINKGEYYMILDSDMSGNRYKIICRCVEVKPETESFEIGEFIVLATYSRGSSPYNRYPLYRGFTNSHYKRSVERDIREMWSEPVKIDVLDISAELLVGDWDFVAPELSNLIRADFSA